MSVCLTDQRKKAMAVRAKANLRHRRSTSLCAMQIVVPATIVIGLKGGLWAKSMAIRLFDDKSGLKADWIY